VTATRTPVAPPATGPGAGDVTSGTGRAGPGDVGVSTPDPSAATDRTQGEARAAAMADALAIIGPSVTAPRRAILDAMLGSARVRTPEDLLREARLVAPATSLATVYRTLERLGAAGRIKRATLRSGAVGYAYCGTDHHEHAICVGCGRLRPLSPCLISGAPALGGFVVTTHVLDFYGLCERCAADAERAAAADGAAGTADPTGATAADPVPESGTAKRGESKRS
jgi:Fe2+ or Zn2+ uptake regulation protein